MAGSTIRRNISVIVSKKERVSPRTARERCRSWNARLDFFFCRNNVTEKIENRGSVSDEIEGRIGYAHSLGKKKRGGVKENLCMCGGAEGG